jgi:F0F1-type ATP synthase assembly protein I
MLFDKAHIITIFSKLIFAFLWAFILGWLCSKGYTALSWFLVLLPFVMMLLVAFGIMRHMSEIDKLNPLKN